MMPAPAPQQSQAPARSEPTTEWAAFEALFAKRLKPTGPFADDLRRIGFDPAQPQPKYHSRIFQEAVRVACRHVYPGVPEPDAMRRLGATFMEGFAQTIIGGMVFAMVKVLPAAMLVKRIPKLVTMGRTELSAEVAELAPNHWRVTYTDRFALPEFIQGVHDVTVQRGVWKEARLVSQGPTGYVMELRA